MFTVPLALSNKREPNCNRQLVKRTSEGVRSRVLAIPLQVGGSVHASNPNAHFNRRVTRRRGFLVRRGDVACRENFHRRRSCSSRGIRPTDILADDKSLLRYLPFRSQGAGETESGVLGPL